MRRLAALTLLPLLALAPLASADDPPPSAGKPAPPPAPKASPVPDPDPWISIEGASLAGVSRDGKVVLILTPHSSVRQVYRIGPDGGWPVRLTFRRENVGFVALSPLGTQAIVGWDKDGDEDYGLYLVDVAHPGPETPLRVLPRVQHGDVHWSREGDRIYFRDNADGEADFHLREMRMADRSVRTILAKPGSWSVEDVAPGDERLLVGLSRGNADSSLFLLESKTGALKEIDPAPTGTTRSIEDGRFLGNGDRAVFLSDRGGEWRRPYVVSFPNGAVRPLVADDDGRHGPDVEELAVTEVGTWAYMVTNDGGRGRISGIFVDSGTPSDAPEVGDGLAANLAIDGDDAVLFTLQQSDSPGLVMRWLPHPIRLTGWRPGPGRTLTYPDFGGLTVDALPEPPRLVEYPSFDGAKIPAWLYLPHDRAPKSLPFIVSYHGGPEGQDRPYFNAERAYLLSLGYGVLAPNVRGSTGYGKAYRDADNYKKRLDSVKDGKAAVDWLVSQGLADRKRIAAMGGSYGGYMVLAELTEFPDTFAAGIEAVGIANFETFLEKTSAYRRALREAEYGPLSDREFLRSISPIYKCDRITAALLVGHGANDPRVPVEEAKQIEAAMAGRGRTVVVKVFPDEGHGFRKHANRRTWLRLEAEFLRDTIGTSEPGPSSPAPASSPEKPTR